MEYVAHFVACGFIVLAWVLMYKQNQKMYTKRHAEMIEAQKEIEETIGTVIADAIKSGMSAEK